MFQIWISSFSQAFSVLSLSSHYNCFIPLLLSCVSLFPSVFLALFPTISHPLSSLYLCEYSSVCIHVSVRVWEGKRAALAGGGGERERRSERGRDIHTERSKAFTGTKHAVSISQIRAAYSPLFYLKADYSSFLQSVLGHIINFIVYESNRDRAYCL